MGFLRSAGRTKVAHMHGRHHENSNVYVVVATACSRSCLARNLSHSSSRFFDESHHVQCGGVTSIFGGDKQTHVRLSSGRPIWSPEQKGIHAIQVPVHVTPTKHNQHINTIKRSHTTHNTKQPTQQ